MKLVLSFLFLFPFTASAAQFVTCDIGFFNDSGFITDHETDYEVGKSSFVLVANDAKIVAYGDPSKLAKELAAPIQGNLVLLNFRSATDLEIVISPVRPTADDKAAEVVKLDTISAKAPQFPLTINKNLPKNIRLMVHCERVYSLPAPAL